MGNNIYDYNIFMGSTGDSRWHVTAFTPLNQAKVKH